MKTPFNAVSHKGPFFFWFGRPPKEPSDGRNNSDVRPPIWKICASSSCSSPTLDRIASYSRINSLWPLAVALQVRSARFMKMNSIPCFLGARSGRHFGKSWICNMNFFFKLWRRFLYQFGTFFLLSFYLKRIFFSYFLLSASKWFHLATFGASIFGRGPKLVVGEIFMALGNLRILQRFSAALFFALPPNCWQHGIFRCAPGFNQITEE